MDAHKNFAYGTVSVAPSPPASGTTVVLGAGQGALMPTAPFNAVVCPANVIPLASNAEIVRVSNVSTDTLTIARTQEGTSARSILVGDQFAAAITAKTFTDIEALLTRTTEPATYVGTPNATVFYTGLSVVDESVITSRTSSGITTLGNFSIFQQNVAGLSAFIARWDEGDPAVYTEEYILVTT